MMRTVKAPDVGLRCDREPLSPEDSNVRTVSIGGRRTLVTIVTTAVVAGVLAVTGVNSIAGATETTDPATSDTLGAHGVLVGQAADGDSEESVTINNPPAGVYDIEVDGFDVPAGTTTYNYLDVFFSATLGSLDVDATPVALGGGGTGSISGSVTALVAPAAGRQLFGDMTVITTQGAVVGRGSVAIGAVTP
jgi:hypothetical protein